RLQTLNLTGADVVRALQGQNVQVASGVLNAPPMPDQRAFQIAVQTQGRLSDPAEFSNIVIKETPNAIVRLKDVARVEINGLDYSSNFYRDRDPSVGIAIFQQPGSNALATADAIEKTMKKISESFPADMEYGILYNPTQFIRES